MSTETVDSKTEEKKPEPVEVKDMPDKDQEDMMKDMPPPEGYEKGLPLVDGQKSEDEKVEEKVEEKKEPEPEKKEEKTPEDSVLKIETALQHPREKNEYTKNLSPAEWALYKQMRRDRKARQKAESDRDKALFTLTKQQKETEEPKEKDPFEGKDSEDFLTVKEAKEVLAKQKESAKKDKPPEADPMQIRYLKMCEKEAKATHDDFETVMELTHLLQNDTDSLVELQTRVNKGENPALAMYDIIRGHDDFEDQYKTAEIKAKAKKAVKEPPVEVKPDPAEKEKEAEAKRAQEALEKNNESPKTTAHVSSRESKPSGEVTMEEITSMSDIEFAKLPKKTREQYLKKYGV